MSKCFAVMFQPYRCSHTAMTALGKPCLPVRSAFLLFTCIKWLQTWAGGSGLVGRCVGLVSALVKGLCFITRHRQDARKGSSAPYIPLACTVCEIMVRPAVMKLSGRICFCCSVACFGVQKQQDATVASGVTSGCCLLPFNQLVNT